MDLSDKDIEKIKKAFLQHFSDEQELKMKLREKCDFQYSQVIKGDSQELRYNDLICRCKNRDELPILINFAIKERPRVTIFRQIEKDKFPLFYQKRVNGIKQKIFSFLINELNKYQQIKPQVRERLKGYLLSIQIDEIKSINRETLEEFIERIKNYDEVTLFRLLHSLVKDREIDKTARDLFSKTLAHLKNTLIISEQEFQQWISNKLTPDYPEIAQECYLILAIDKSDNEPENTLSQYQLTAWFLDGDPSQPENYNRLDIDENACYTEQNLKPILSQLINEASEKAGKNSLTIEFFVPDKLLSTNFDCWECELCEDPTQLSRITYVHVRSLSRLDTKYKTSVCQQKWKTRWEQINQSFVYSETSEEQARINDPECHFCQDSTLWVNLCTATPENLITLFRKTRKYGIPIAIWSRCHPQETPHRQEINTLVSRCRGQLNRLPERIKSRRNQAPSDLKNDPNNLGHHLSLLWEDPNRLPPIPSLWKS